MTYKSKPGSKSLKAVHLCEHEGCRRYTMYQLCAEHRPPEPIGEWAVAQQISREQDDDEDQQP